MIMKNRILLLLFLIPSFGFAQLSVEYDCGYGVYTQMGGVRQLLDAKLLTVQEDLPNAAIVANFPNYLTYSVGLNYIYGREEFGFQVTRMSTGGKIAYSDYSGQYSNKLTLSAVRIGTRYRYDLREYLFKQKYKLMVYGEVSPGVIVTTAKNSITDKYPTETVTEDGDDDYTSTAFSLLPQIGVKTTSGLGRFGIQATIGYDIELAGNLDNGYNTKISWMGIRTAIGVFYTFPPKSKKPKKKKDDDDQF